MDDEADRPAAIDWQAIAQRLEAARAATEQAWTPDADAAARVLDARARALAAEPDDAQHVSALEVVEFLLAHERYAVETRCVREIYPLTNLTPLPCTPAFVLGIVNLRGEIVSVIDIKKFFDLPNIGLSDLNKVLVLESESMCFGVLADAIVGVHRIPVDWIQPVLPTLTGIREQYLQGVTSDRMIILDASSLLADAEIVVQERVEG
jgi:purine-binding chemotaxis protein CheW